MRISGIEPSSVILSQKKYIQNVEWRRYREIFKVNLDKKEEIWPSPMTKAPTPTEMSKGQSDNTNNATKKFD